MSNQTKKERKVKLNKLSNDRNIKLINGNRSFINNGENIRNQQKAFCSSLPFGTSIPPSIYIDIESTTIISSDASEISNELMEDGKSKFIDTKNELLKHKELIKSKLGYTTIKEFRDELTSLKTILNEINKLKLETKRKFNMLDDNISDTLEELDVDLTTLELKYKFFENFEKPHDFEKERKLRLSAKQKVNEIERLKEKVKKKKDDSEAKNSELLTGVELEKHDALHHITILE